MKHIKRLGVLAGAATALMAFAGTASATITSPPGTKATTLTAASLSAALDGTVSITCKGSHVHLTPVKPSDHSAEAGSTTLTNTTLSFTECSRSVTVTANGSVSIESNGEVKSTGARVTVQTTILGFPVHCIYATNNTKVGTLTEGVNPPVIHIGSSPIPQEATSGACGNDAVWTGTYTVSTPASAIVVD